MEPVADNQNDCRVGRRFKSHIWWLLGVAALLLALYMAREALAVTFTAFIFASALLPFVETLDRRLPRWLAVLIPYSALLLIGLVLVLPIVAIAAQQLQRFIADIPNYLEQLRQWWTHDRMLFEQRYPFMARLTPDTLFAQLSAQNGAVFSGFTGVTLAISQISLDLLSALVISIFLLLDRERIQHYFLQFHPTDRHEPLSRLIDNLIRSTGAFVNGQLLFMVFIGVMITLGLYGIGLPFAVLLGLLTGLLSIIPILGPNIAMLPALAIAMSMPGGGWTALWVFLLYIIVQVIANNIIGPLIMGRAVGLPPIAILLALLAGGMMFGMAGVVLAIPLAACLNIILETFRHHPIQLEAPSA